MCEAIKAIEVMSTSLAPKSLLVLILILLLPIPHSIPG